MSQQYFIKCHHHKLSDIQKTMASLLCSLETITFSGDFNFSHSDFLILISYVNC